MVDHDLVDHDSVDRVALDRTVSDRSASLPLRALQMSLGLVVVSAAVVSGVSVGGGDKKMIVLPLAAVLGLALAVFACTRFGGFVLLLLGIRSSIDALALNSASSEASGGAVLARGINPSSLMAVLFLLASLLWLSTQYYSGKLKKPSRLGGWLIAFWLAGVVSIAGSHHVQAGVMESLRILAVVMMFVVLEQLITSRQAMARVLVAAYASLLIPLGYTLYGYALGHPASEEKSGLTRILGTFSQSNAYGRYLAFMVVFGIAVYPHVKGKFRPALAVLLTVSSVFLLLTLTLTAILAAAAGLLLVGLLTRRRSIIVGFVAVVVSALLLVPGLSSRINTVQSEPQANSGPAGDTLAWRFGYWAEVLPLANANPVTGIGIGSTSYETDVAKQPHNDFLRAYVETGLLGLMVYVGMLGALISVCRRAVRRSAAGGFDHAIAVGALASATACIIMSMASNVITNSVALWYLIAFVAAAAFVGGPVARGQAQSRVSPRAVPLVP